MSTQPFPNDNGDSESIPPDENAQLAGRPSDERSSTGRKQRQRSAYLFPAYGFTTALDIARRVEEGGGGTLSEETLALNLGLSAKSSGFRLKSLAARQFQLITKQGDTLSTTPVAKAIFKPTSNEDALRGYRLAFLSIPLFKAVAERYRGQRLPDSQTLRNVLEREFQVEHARVQQAERMLLDSARDAHLLKHRGDGTYLVVSDGALGGQDDPGEIVAVAPDALNVHNGNSWPALPHQLGAQPNDTLTFAINDIANLKHEEFEDVWRALGILVRARRSSPDQQAQDDE